MKRILATALIANLLLAACSTQVKEQNDWDSYQSLAQSIQATVKTASIKELASKSVELTKISTKLLPAFIEKEAVCKEYLDAALSAADSMLTSSLVDIERDYHADGKLPTVQSVSCYHAKDLLVHPATMAVIAKTQQDSEATREKIEHELEEVLEHFNLVKQAAGI